jgi:hypothetical protein
MLKLHVAFVLIVSLIALVQILKEHASLFILFMMCLFVK